MDFLIKKDLENNRIDTVFTKRNCYKVLNLSVRIYYKSLSHVTFSFFGKLAICLALVMELWYEK